MRSARRVIAHGSQKLFGRFGGFGINGTCGYMESIGLRHGRLMAVAAGGTELVGGALLALGATAAALAGAATVLGPFRREAVASAESALTAS